MNRRAALSAEQVLERVRGTKEPTRADAARNFAALEARLMLPSASPGSAGARHWPLLARAGKLAAFGLATGMVGYWIGRADAPLRPVESPLPTAPAVAPPSVESAELTRPEASLDAPEPPAPKVERASPRRAPVRPAPRATAHPTNPPLAEEPHRGLELGEALELLRRAEAAARHSDGLQARMWLDDLDRRAPRDLLREERLATSVLASCVLGEVAAARAALAELEQANPQSMYRSRLEGSCATAAPRP